MWNRDTHGKYWAFESKPTWNARSTTIHFYRRFYITYRTVIVDNVTVADVVLMSLRHPFACIVSESTQCGNATYYSETCRRCTNNNRATSEENRLLLRMILTIVQHDSQSGRVSRESSRSEPLRRSFACIRCLTYTWWLLCCRKDTEYSQYKSDGRLEYYISLTRLATVVQSVDRCPMS